MNTKEFYRQKRPHILPEGRTFFITTRLFNSIPKIEIDRLKENYNSKYLILSQQCKGNTLLMSSELQLLHKNYAVDLDNILDKIEYGSHDLKQPEIAQIVADQIHKYNNELYDLRAYCIMSNHIHILLRTFDKEELKERNDMFESYPNVDIIMKKIKGASARYANLLLNREGSFWEKESYDILIRNEKMYYNVLNYILDNPIKAGIVKERSEFKFLYKKEEI